MERELLRIFQTVKEKTGIEIQAISENGIYYAITQEEFTVAPQNVFNANEEIVTENGNTYFKFNYGGNKFIGMIKGDNEKERNYATLIIGYVEFSQNKTVELSYDEQLSLIIVGNTTKSRTLHFMSKYALPKLPVYVMLIKCDEGRAVEVQEFLRTYYGGSDGVITIGADTCAYVKHVESDDNQENLSPTKNAELLKRFIYEELGLNVNVFVGGTVKSFLEVSISYNQASASEKMCELFGFNGGVYAYKDFILAKMIEDNSANKIDEYFNALLGGGGKELLKEKELLITGEAFLANNLNVSETARILYIHRNTLLYRLDKIERLTGLDIRTFSDAINFRILYVLSKLKG